MTRDTDALVEAAIESLLDDVWEREARIADPADFSDDVIHARVEVLAADWIDECEYRLEDR